MKKLLSILPVYLYCLLCLSACEIFCDCEEETKPCLFSYDSVAYAPDGTGQDRIISPSFEYGASQGTFSATPAGLALDSLTGNININASQPKTEYTIVFTLEGGKTNCETKVYIQEPKVTLITCVFRYEKNFFIPGAEEDPVQEPIFEDETKVDGKFTVAPAGLDIDPATGIFNADISEAGLTYTVTYTSEDGNTTCETAVTIAGVDYPDTLIDVSQEQALTVPVINGTLDQKPPAEIVFDPEQEAVQQGLAIQGNGAINVRQTLQNLDRIEYAGEGLPSGYSREFEITYIYQQENVTVSNSIDILIYWYTSEDEVPEDLLETLGRKTPSAEGGKLMHRHPLTVGVNSFK